MFFHSCSQWRVQLPSCSLQPERGVVWEHCHLQESGFLHDKHLLHKILLNWCTLQWDLTHLLIAVQEMDKCVDWAEPEL